MTVRALLSSTLLFLFAFSSGNANAAATDAAPAPPAELADRFAGSLLAAAHKLDARQVRVDLQGDADGGLEGVPALTAISRELELAIYGAGRLSPAGGATPADLEIVAKLSRVRGRVVLGGAIVSHGATVDWVLASTPETPAWWPWLAPIHGAPPEASGFRWSRVGSIEGAVEDADAGDLDGDGRVEFVTVTGEQVSVFRITDAGPELAASMSLDDNAGEEPEEIATRAPRTFVRVSPVPGGAGELFVRRTDEKRTRVYGWDNGHLFRRPDREGLILSSRVTTRGPESVTAEPAPGTDRFDSPPRLRRGSGPVIKSGADSGPWTDLRSANLSPVPALAEAGPSYAWLDQGGTLRLLRADLTEIAHVARCGTAFALADWDGDGKADALCSGDAAAVSGPDRLTLFLSGGGATIAAWNAAVPGPVAAVAAGPGIAGEADALAFVIPDAPPRTTDGAAAGASTEIWMLRRPR